MAKNSKPKSERRVVDGYKIKDERKSRNPVFKFDVLKMYMGLPYTVNVEGTEGSITVNSPTLGQAIELGITRFNIGVNPFVTNTTQYRLPLWDAGIDWNICSDFELFCMLIHAGVDKDVTDILFGQDLDWSKFVLSAKYKEDGIPERILYNEEANIEINETVYFQLSQYIRRMLLRDPDEKFTSDAAMKHAFIMKDKRHRANEEWKQEQGTEEDSASALQTLISACVNHPGFKYKKNELMDITIGEFYDSVKRLQIYESSIASLHGAMGGMIDAKKLPKEATNFMREFSE